MKQRCILILTAYFLLATTMAQQPFDMRSGNAESFSEGQLSPFFDSDEHQYYFLKLNEKQAVEFNTTAPAAIQVFDSLLNPVKQIPLQLSGDAKYRRLTPLAFYKTTEGFIVLCKNYSIMEQIMRAYLFRTDMRGNVLGDMMVPGEVEGVLPGDEDFHYFQLNKTRGEDGPEFVFAITTPSFMEIPERINFVIFDKQLRRTGNRLISFPEDLFDYDISRQLVSPQGQVFFRVEVSSPLLADTVLHQLTIYDLWQDKYRSYEFELQHGKIRELRFQQMEHNRVGLFGFFTRDGTTDVPAGVLYYIFDGSDGRLLKQKISEFSSETAQAFNPRQFKSTSEAQYLKPRSIHLMQNNHVLLLFEYNWRSVLLVRDQQQKIYPSPYFNANEVLVVHFNQSNQFVNVGTIHKHQTMADEPGATGFFSYCTADTLFLLYNDHPKNINRFASGDIKTMKTRYEPVIGIYDPATTSYSKQFPGQEKQKPAFDPTGIFMLPSGNLLILNHKKENYWLSLMEF